MTVKKGYFEMYSNITNFVSLSKRQPWWASKSFVGVIAFREENESRTQACPSHFCAFTFPFLAKVKKGVGHHHQIHEKHFFSSEKLH